MRTARMSVQMPSPDLAVELLERDAFPLGRGLHDLRVDGMQVAIVRDMELDRRARAVAIEHVVDAALHIDDERHFDHHQIEFLAQVVFDIAFHLEDGLLRLFRSQQRTVVVRQDFFQFFVIADSRPCQIGFLIEDNGAMKFLLCGRIPRRRYAIHRGTGQGNCQRRKSQRWPQWSSWDLRRCVVTFRRVRVRVPRSPLLSALSR